MTLVRNSSAIADAERSAQEFARRGGDGVGGVPTVDGTDDARARLRLRRRTAYLSAAALTSAPRRRTSAAERRMPRARARARRPRSRPPRRPSHVSALPTPRVAGLRRDDARGGACDVDRREEEHDDERTPHHHVLVAETRSELAERELLRRRPARAAAPVRRAAGEAPPHRSRSPPPSPATAVRDARPGRDQGLQRIERGVRRELGGERLVQTHEQRPGDAARRRGDRDHDAAQRNRSAIEKDELGEVCVALWPAPWHCRFASDVANQNNHHAARCASPPTTSCWEVSVAATSSPVCCDVSTRTSIALQEVSDVDHIRELADDLGMEVLLGEPSDPESRMHTAILTRLPVRSWRNRRHHGRMLRSHLHCDDRDRRAARSPLRRHPLPAPRSALWRAQQGRGPAHPRDRRGAHRHQRRAPAAARAHRATSTRLRPGDDILATAFFRRMNELRRAGLLVAGVQRHAHAAASPPADGDPTESRIAGDAPGSILASSAASPCSRAWYRR